MDLVDSAVASDLLRGLEREYISILLAVQLRDFVRFWSLTTVEYGIFTQNDPFGFAIFGLHNPVTEGACLPKFFQLRRSVDEYIMGV